MRTISRFSVRIGLLGLVGLVGLLGPMGLLVLAPGCGDDDGSGNHNQNDTDASVSPDAYVGPCHENAMPLFEGDYQCLVDSLTIAYRGEGFDLDGDGYVDNMLGPLGALVNAEIAGGFDEGDIVVQFELFDLEDPVNDDCANLAVYFGFWPPDQDEDGEQSGALVRDGEEDCNDWDPAHHPDATEIPGDRVDNDCNGWADETRDATGEVVPPTDDTDVDGDGFSPAQGDCDDRAPGDWIDPPPWWDPLLRNPSQLELCGDGLDNDCDGIADEDCDPYSTADGADERVPVDVNSLNADQSAGSMSFRSARVEQGLLRAGPGTFAFAVEVDGKPLDLRMVWSQLEAELMTNEHGLFFDNVLLGGVLQAYNLDQMPNVAADFLGEEGTTMLDAFVGPAGILLDLQAVGVCREREGNKEPLLPPVLCDVNADCGDTETVYCDVAVRAPDIDIDGDGIELFLDLNLDGQAATYQVDTCIDGDGSIYYDELDVDGAVLSHCTEVTDDQGNWRFADGYSMTLTLTATPTNLYGIYTPPE
jgi:hypothetical protein